MDDNFNLMQALQNEWDAVGGAPGYREALRRWQAVEPDLAGLGSPADVVAWCRTQADPGEANRPVGALLRVAADRVAARTLLQLIIPGLTVRMGRALGREASCRRMTGVKDELVQEVVAAAWERIAALAGTTPRWPACELVEGAWRRVRHQRERGRACRRRLWPLEEAREAVEPEWTRTTAEAVRQPRHRSDPGPARLCAPQREPGRLRRRAQPALRPGHLPLRRRRPLLVRHHPIGRPGGTGPGRTSPHRGTRGPRRDRRPSA